MIGKQLGGRYTMIGRIGGGGMAIVYKANDELLNRHVAIKILRQQYIHDEDFIRRFRREAQSAASLSHPNIVNIYDVGQDGDIHYIVMEYVEGRNLNELIKERAPLQVEETVNIAMQICDALDHAHQNGIIHRDIKPHNIMIGRNGRVKVADFGIARAATSSDITQTGSILGSVHYFSPEHAKGISQGAKSDIYSLGIVMYQMLTDRLPFLGDSPITVALKHLQDDVPDPRSINPLIPQSVENIILKALRKKPEERYGSAKEILHDLEVALLPENMNAPKITFDPAEEDDADKTIVMPAIRSGRTATSEAGVTNLRNNSGQRPEKDPKPKKKLPVWLKPAIWGLVFVILLAVAWYGIQKIQEGVMIPDVEVPNVVGLPLEEAEQALAERGLGYEIIREDFSDEIARNAVISQNTQEGMTVKEGRKIGLVISKGPRIEVMPDYRGRLYDEVLIEMRQLGFREELITLRHVADESEPGTIVEQLPSPDTEIVLSETEVEFVVSQGPGTFGMPNLIGYRENEALSELTKWKLVPKIERAPDYAIQEGRVFQQHPQPNDPVSEGEEVTIYVSTGLPEDARVTQRIIELLPEEQGKTTVYDIFISDAKGVNRSWGTKEVTEPMVISVQVVTSPTQHADIILHRNGRFLNSIKISYSQASQDTIPGSESDIPGKSPGDPPDPGEDGEPGDHDSGPGDDEAEQPASGDTPGNGEDGDGEEVPVLPQDALNDAPFSGEPENGQAESI